MPEGVGYRTGFDPSNPSGQNRGRSMRKRLSKRKRVARAQEPLEVRSNRRGFEPMRLPDRIRTQADFNREFKGAPAEVRKEAALAFSNKVANLRRRAERDESRAKRRRLFNKGLHFLFGKGR